MKRYMITTDYYDEFEIITAPDIITAEDYIYNSLEGKETQGVELFGSSEDMTEDEAKEVSDVILYITDYMED